MCSSSNQPGSGDANVRYVHTKYMLVDPLSPYPVLVTGAANVTVVQSDAIR
jgi:hypothetical protein